MTLGRLPESGDLLQTGAASEKAHDPRAGRQVPRRDAAMLLAPCSGNARVHAASWGPTGLLSHLALQRRANRRRLGVPERDVSLWGWSGPDHYLDAAILCVADFLVRVRGFLA